MKKVMKEWNGKNDGMRKKMEWIFFVWLNLRIDT